MTNEFKILIQDFPLAITVNQSLQPAHGRLVHTKLARDYSAAVDTWILRNRKFVAEMRCAIKNVPHGTTIRLLIKS